MCYVPELKYVDCLLSGYRHVLGLDRFLESASQDSEVATGLVV